MRIRNGEVCYWPNLGYGRFGAKVTMDNAPWFDAPDQFDQRRIRLADIDGSGTTDIIYLGGHGPQIPAADLDAERRSPYVLYRLAWILARDDHPWYLQPHPRLMNMG